MKIIYEDAEKLIVEKPAGVLTQSARSFDTDLVSEVLTYRRSKKETAYAAVINRLDRPVGGLVLFAKTKQVAARLSKEMQQNTLNKQYYALICGKPEQSKGTFVDYLQKDAKANVSKVVSKESKEAKRAELEYEVLKTVYVQAHEQMPAYRKTSPDTGAVCFPQSAVTGRHEIWRTDRSRLPDGFTKKWKTADTAV